MGGSYQEAVVLGVCGQAQAEAHVVLPLRYVGEGDSSWGEREYEGEVSLQSHLATLCPESCCCWPSEVPVAGSFAGIVHESPCMLV